MGQCDWGERDSGLPRKSASTLPAADRAILVASSGGHGHLLPYRQRQATRIGKDPVKWTVATELRHLGLSRLALDTPDDLGQRRFKISVGFELRARDN